MDLYLIFHEMEGRGTANVVKGGLLTESLMEIIFCCSLQSSQSIISRQRYVMVATSFGTLKETDFLSLKEKGVRMKVIARPVNRPIRIMF